MAARSSPSDARRTRRGPLPTLRTREDFAHVSAKGRTRADRLMVIRFVPNARDHDRYGISTGRRLGGAVQRNRVRRRLREILRADPNPSGHGWDILIVAKPAAVHASFEELRDATRRMLDAVRRSVKATA